MTLFNNVHCKHPLLTEAGLGFAWLWPPGPNLHTQILLNRVRRVHVLMGQSSARPALWACDLRSHTGPVCRRPCALVGCSAVAVLTFIIIFEEKVSHDVAGPELTTLLREA